MYSIISSLILWAPGPGELLIIAIIILFLFGGRKLPELMRGIGKGIREFNAAKANVRTEVEEGLRAEERKTAEHKKMDDSPQSEKKIAPRHEIHRGNLEGYPTRPNYLHRCCYFISKGNRSVQKL